MIFPVSLVFPWLIRILILRLLVTSVNGSILHCLNYDENSTLEDICLKCERNYILNQLSTSCEPQVNFITIINCIQISSFGECMRCDCGYAIQEPLGNCVLATKSLTGCEKFTLKENNLCTRPKRDYLLLKGIQDEVTVQFARGTHCEIFDSVSNHCIQCHSGYLLSQDYLCKKYPNRIFNEYFSFFSSDGELLSRSLLFTALSNGVYPKIKNCQIHSKNLKEFSLECELCNSGRVLNQNKTKCIKHNVDFCKIIEASNGSSQQNVCSECLDNDHFYSSGSDPNQQACQPRSNSYDPTIQCLVQFDNLPGCQKCALGLFPTFTGCSLENPRFLSSQEQPYLPWQILENQLFYESCEHWIDEKTCGSCKRMMIPNNIGICMYNSDVNCLLANENGSCAQCISLMYYNQKHRKCVFIENYLVCRFSLGRSNSCEICIWNYYTNETGICERNQTPSCSLSQGKYKQCEICFNLHYLTEDFLCKQITSYENCLLSDGINNFCFKCIRGYSSNEEGNCISKINKEGQVCESPLFFLEEQDSPAEGDNLSDTRCVKYSFKSQFLCERFHKTKNECLECSSGYQLINGNCELIQFCISSNGLDSICYQYQFEAQFLDKHGNIKRIFKTCDKKKLETMCASCFLDNTTEGILVDYEKTSGLSSQQPQQSDSVCTPFNEVASLEVFPNCLHLAFQDNSFKCMLCLNLYYLNDKGECNFFPEDSKCEISDGKSLKCIRCSKSYNLNLEDDSQCEISEQLDVIPFCEIYQGIECKKCKNLYYIGNNGRCYLILDPDCESSDGVSKVCQQCKNGYTSIELFQIGFLCNSNLCTSMEPTTNECQKCINGYILVEAFGKQQGDNHRNEKFICVLKVHYCLESDKPGICSQCQEGYYLDKNRLHQGICLRIPIENCIVFNSDNHTCSKCKEGYDILQSGLCFKLTRCLEYHNGCLRCSKEFFLKDGVCVKITNCIDQLQYQCLQCAPGYWVRRYSMNNLKIILRDSIIEQDICQKIPNCAKSEGIYESCIICESGFDLINEMCIQKNLLLLSNCLVYYESSTQCQKCMNLFFITNDRCLPIKDSNNCQLSDGINDICQLCSFNGFQLIDNICLKIDNCIISNGIDVCILCEENYIVNYGINRGCDKVNVQIPNCQIISYDRISDTCQEFPPQKNELIQTNNESKIGQTTKNKFCQESQSSWNQDNQNKIQVCFQCENFYYLKSNQQECLPIPVENSNNCNVSDGQSQLCSFCAQGYVLMEAKQQIVCQIQNKKVNKWNNLGCKQFSYVLKVECLKCEAGFYMMKTLSQCKHRKEIDTKCLHFSPRKDECEICRSGYKMKEVIIKDSKMKFCMKLEAKEEVRNCLEYQPNTNKCIKCQKNVISYDVVEYVLDEEKNICESVLHLMCRTIDIARKQCEEFFIPNCEIAVGQKCEICKNGFYLNDSQLQQLSFFTGYYHCVKHKVIRNCLVYSQNNQDSCEVCEDYYELVEKSQEKVCSQIEQNNCKQTKGSTCVECSSDRFAIDVTSGICLISQISKCLELKLQQNLQVCLKCSNNYILSENKSECIWRLHDLNCINSDQFRNCLECKEGYLLTQKGDCIRINSSCSLLNCLKYKDISESEQMICEQCSSNYVLDKDQSCQLLDHNASQLDTNTTNSESSKDSQSNEERISSFWIVVLLIIVVAFILSMLIYCVIKVWRMKIKNAYLRDLQTQSRYRVDIEISNDQSKEINSQIENENINKEIVFTAGSNEISYMQFNSLSE